MKIENSVILVTGANRGIGKAYVEAFLAAGARKIYLGVRNIESVREMVEKAPDILVPLQLDVTKQADIDAAAKKATDVEILINNAGILHLGDLKDEGFIQNAREEMEVNYFAPMAMMLAFAPVLKNNGGGLIASVASIASFLSFPGLPSYCASKAAAHSLIMAARIALSAQGTKIIGVYPGPIDTDMGSELNMPAEPPSLVADETIKTIISGAQDVFPDEMSRELYQAYKDDPQAIEAKMLAMYQEAA